MPEFYSIIIAREIFFRIFFSVGGHVPPAIVREYVFAVFWKSKKRDFLRFLKRHLKKTRKNVIQNSKFQTADFSLDGISTTAQKQCMFIMYMALVVA